MGNFKVKVNSEAESKEVMSLLDMAGYTKGAIDNISKPCWIAVLDGKKYSDYMLSKTTWYTANPKETTLPELRVMVNDQYAEIEQVRQHRHYFIDVSDVDEIDFYEIALRYNVTDPCIQHILKKCLATGQRGQKDFHHDLKDIHDTAKRMLDVHGLDS